MITRIDHLGIAVRSLEETIPYYENVLGLHCEGREEVESQKVRTAFFACGDVHLELLEPTAEDSPIAKFLDKNGPGIHHLAYQVDGLEGRLASLKGQGVRLIDESPRLGAHHSRIAFLHPKASGGVLTELCEAGK